MREILFRGKRIDTGEWVEAFSILKLQTLGEWKWLIGASNNAYMTFDKDFNLKEVETLGEPIYYNVDPNTVEQFTGLTDKNGKKIFEGDIVKCRHRLVKFHLDDIKNANPRRSYGKEIEETDSYGFSCVYWRNYAVSFRDGIIRIQNGSDHHEIRKNYIYNHEIEVIGNIHDNPELLGGKYGN